MSKYLIRTSDIKDAFKIRDKNRTLLISELGDMFDTEHLNFLTDLVYAYKYVETTMRANVITDIKNTITETVKYILAKNLESKLTLDVSTELKVYHQPSFGDYTCHVNIYVKDKFDILEIEFFISVRRPNQGK